MRIVIAGGPRTGKTTLSQRMGAPVMHTDDLLGKGYDWSAQSRMVSEWFHDSGPWVIEGVTVPRALRKWLTTSAGKPCDRLIYIRRPKVPRNQGQETMAQGCDRVFREILPILRGRGVEVEYR